MKQEGGWWFHYSDEIMNLFKLKLYKWNVNDAKKYYKNDKFCNDYCIDKDWNQYGCSKKKCPFQHSINLYDLFNVERDYKQVKLLCLYLMYKKVYDQKNPALFNWYAWALMKSGTSKQDYFQSEKYFLKSLNIDHNYENAHSGYAYLLAYKFDNYEKAEYHYNKSLTIDPNTAIGHANFAGFLIDKRLKYDEGLSHSEKACKLKPNLSWAHYMKAGSLYKLKRFDESLKEYQLALKLNENDGRLLPNNIQIAKKQIYLLPNQIDEEKIKRKEDSKREERESRRMEKKNEKEFENKKNKDINIDKEQHENGSNETNGQIKTSQQQMEQLACAFFYHCYWCSLSQATFFV